MEPSHRYHYSKPPPRAALLSGSPPRQTRLRGTIVDLHPVRADGLIQLAERQLPFRAIDIVGTQLPQLGEQVSFVLLSAGGLDRAVQVVLDADPQFIPGQSSLSECYQAQAKNRAAKLAQRQQRVPHPTAAAELGQGLKYRRCDTCQKLVLPQLRLKRYRPRSAAEPWSSLCPLCKGSLDNDSQSFWSYSLLLMLFLAALFSWWRW